MTAPNAAFQCAIRWRHNACDLGRVPKTATALAVEAICTVLKPTPHDAQKMPSWHLRHRYSAFWPVVAWCFLSRATAEPSTSTAPSDVRHWVVKANLLLLASVMCTVALTGSLAWHPHQGLSVKRKSMPMLHELQNCYLAV